MLTRWGKQLDRNAVLQEYPRPQLKRESYLNLNGLWDFAFTDTPETPAVWEGKILVPFSPESALSGVERTLAPGEFLWYGKDILPPEDFRRGRLILNFGAVDQIAEVFVDGVYVCTHCGGYTPFSADITDFIHGSGFRLTVRVQDFSEKSYYARGRQRLKRGGLWHSAQSGIWQTVWLECVPENHIRALRIIPHFDDETVELWVAGEGQCTAEIDGRVHSFPAGSPAILPVGEMWPWTPDDPYLYMLKLTLGQDHAESYFAMRKFTVSTDSKGVKRFFLNNEPIFCTGVLDQGMWPDGLMTAPTDEALQSDIRLAREMGFNTIRKHMKIEPARWYYHCDRLGMMVWQDMPAGGTGSFSAVRSGRDDRYRKFGRASVENRRQYLTELREMLTALGSCPCIVLWTPFSEGWGQFDAVKVAQFVQRYDRQRVIDHVGGGCEQGWGEIQSSRLRGKKYNFRPDSLGRAVVLSQFGGYSFRVEGHCWGPKEYGSIKFESANSYKYALWDLYREQIRPAAAEGLAGCIYEQMTDVEDELNGLVTYDRDFVKLAPQLVRGIVGENRK
ncbi:MAG: glycoside hydrolase family 2 [Oscillospiraceae bacterium]|nr:glycoside hydrolase family 2 [Oscillospiraceae bacterium]